MNTGREWWSDLPAGVRTGLLLGAEGSVHLMDLAQQTLVAAQDAGPRQDALLRAGIGFLQAAWSKDPLNGQLAEQTLALDAKWPCLDPAAREVLRAVTGQWRKPEDMRYYRRLLEGRDSAKLRHFLTVQMDREPGNVYWWRQALVFAQFEEDWDLAARVVADDWPAGLQPVQSALRGDLAWLAGDYDASGRQYAAACGLDARFRLALLHTRRDGLEEARSEWRSLLRDAPWMTQAVLVCHDLLHGVDKAAVPVPGRGVVALYSYNKVRELDLTLRSVTDSDLDGADVWVLDNGSSDGTADMLAAWAERLGARMRIIALPVNVGAPAARNWLLHAAAQAEYGWMAYVDDDVEVPQDWLRRLGAAMLAYPEAGVWGCKVVDAAAPVVLQSVDLHLVPTGEQDGLETRFKVSDLHHQTLDFGQFAYMRPCASVTGCCHLFRMDRLLDCGAFDLRFSPSQYDDLEHDVRLNLAGRYAVYQGHLPVLHMKRTGKSTRTDTAQFGSAAANMHKLQKKYGLEEYRQLMAWESGILEEDYWRKVGLVSEWLAGER